MCFVDSNRYIHLIALYLDEDNLTLVKKKILFVISHIVTNEFTCRIAQIIVHSLQEFNEKNESVNTIFSIIFPHIPQNSINGIQFIFFT